VSALPLTSQIPSAAASAAAAVPQAPQAGPASVVPAGDPAAFEPGEDVVLDASKLHCYQVALELHTLCCTLVALLNRIVKDQLERASLSVVLNIAEAGGRRSRRDKARFYTIARGSATEVAALLDVLEMRRLASPATLRTARRRAIRVIQMLSKIDRRLVAM
jgi:four helix bundle protein